MNDKKSASITFYGGAGTVTGANFLLDTGNKKILMDCGALQREGYTCDVENLKPFAYEPHSMDVLIVTHAHQDHIGRIPRLVHEGFSGVIYSTPATRDLAAIMFEDSLSVMAREQELHGCTPQYDAHAVERALSLWKTHEYHESFSIGDGTFSFLDAGHVLGSAIIKCERNEKVLLFTGDLGNSPDPLLPDTESAEGAHYIVMESVYGDRLHEDKENRTDILAEAIRDTQKIGGTLLIPSFSLERTQILLFEIKELLALKKIQPIPVYLDAPLGIRVTEVFRKYASLFNEHVRDSIQQFGDAFTFDGLHVVHNTRASANIHESADPKIIIAGAGMSNGGRIRAHEMKYLGDKNAHVLFVGYQAPGSLGRRIQDGNKNVKIDGKPVTVRASISSLGGYSGHRDRDGLMQFVEGSLKTIQEVFVTMGEPKAELFLAQRLRDFFSINAQVPESGQTISIQW
ncbi:MAG: RNA-metabolising metallo-beta-lactamase, metallo-beta-lactamase family protein [Candidatus Kaiserbacteria bacterium]|nr:RNA-metabolising metallo-beta-lactamase, metallo-beta-lactamase family protein [Candidatus Kaiserbacteria bacterium]